MAPYSKPTAPERNISGASHAITYRKGKSLKDTLVRAKL